MLGLYYLTHQRFILVPRDGLRILLNCSPK